VASTKDGQPFLGTEKTVKGYKNFLQSRSVTASLPIKNYQCMKDREKAKQTAISSGLVGSMEVYEHYTQRSWKQL